MNWLQSVEIEVSADFFILEGKNQTIFVACDMRGKGKYESGSITLQRRLIQNYINKHDEFKKCKIIERFDDGLSGRYFDTRPGFTEMIELCRKGKINCIIVSSQRMNLTQFKK